MTPDEIINEVWKLSWYDVLKIAIMDDFILAVKIWPCYALLTVWPLSTAVLHLLRRRRRAS